MIHSLFPDLGTVFLDFASRSPVLVFIYIIFITIITFVLLNMLVGIMCQVAHVTAALEKEERAATDLRDELAIMLCDEDQNSIGPEVLDVLIEDPENVKFMLNMGIDVVDLVEQAHILFPNHLRYDFNGFVNMLMNMRGSNQITFKDLCSLKSWMFHEFQNLSGNADDPKDGCTPSAVPV